MELQIALPVAFSPEMAVRFSEGDDETSAVARVTATAAHGHYDEYGDSVVGARFVRFSAGHLQLGAYLSRLLWEQTSGPPSGGKRAERLAHAAQG